MRHRHHYRPGHQSHCLFCYLARVLLMMATMLLIVLLLALWFGRMANALDNNATDPGMYPCQAPSGYCKRSRPRRPAGYLPPYESKFLGARRCLHLDLIWGTEDLEAVKCQIAEGWFMFVPEDTD